MKTQASNPGTRVWLFVVIPAILITYPILRIVVADVIRAVVPEVVRSVLHVI
jgi:hypothetical protein